MTRYLQKRLVGVLLPLLAAMPASAVEHPGTIPKGAQCASCHADKTSGRSVHAVMEAPCTVCHLEKTEGDMTTVNLAVPKEQLCSECHSSMALQKHPPNPKGQCLDCHDAHRSRRLLLLRERVANFPDGAQSVQAKSTKPPGTPTKSH